MQIKTINLEHRNSITWSNFYIISYSWDSYPLGLNSARPNSLPICCQNQAFLSCACCLFLFNKLTLCRASLMTLPHQQRIWLQQRQVPFSCGSNKQQDSTMLRISAGSLVYLPRRMPKLLKFPVKDCPGVQILIEYNGRFFLVITNFWTSHY